MVRVIYNNIQTGSGKNKQVRVSQTRQREVALWWHGGELSVNFVVASSALENFSHQITTWSYAHNDQKNGQFKISECYTADVGSKSVQQFG